MKATRSTRKEVGMYGGIKGESEEANAFVTGSVDCELREEEATERGNMLQF